MIILLIIIFIFIGLIQILSLIRKKYWRELVWFCILHTLSFVLCLLLAVGVKLPNLTKGINTFLYNINLHFWIKPGNYVLDAPTAKRGLYSLSPSRLRRATYLVRGRQWGDKADVNGDLRKAKLTRWMICLFGNRQTLLFNLCLRLKSLLREYIICIKILSL